MKVAIPTEKGEICEDLGKSNEFTIYDVENELVQNRQVITVEKTEDSDMADFLEKNNVNIVICNHILSSIKSSLRKKRIELITGVDGKADANLIRYLSGERLGNSQLEPSHYNYESNYISYRIYDDK